MTTFCGLWVLLSSTGTEQKFEARAEEAITGANARVLAESLDERVALRDAIIAAMRWAQTPHSWARKEG